MTPPQASEAAVDAHAMTAQAGAVACDVVLPSGGVVATRVDIDYADELLSQHMWRGCKKANFLYTTPPAAVPVEALEGLVAELRNEAGDWTNGDVRAAYSRISDRIERLIKERSNG